MVKIYNLKHKTIGQEISHKLPQFINHKPLNDSSPNSNTMVGTITNGGFRVDNSFKISDGNGILSLPPNKLVKQELLTPRTRTNNKETLIRMKF